MESSKSLEDQFETLIDGLMSGGYGYLPDFIPPELLADLRADLQRCHENGLMRPAGVGRQSDFGHRPEIRNDLTLWLDKANSAAQRAYLELVEEFVAYLNRTCFTGINAYEFHYAWYDTGSFYKRHRDRFQSDSGRMFSLVSYLNDNWTEADGGQIALYLPDETIQVLPSGGTAVFFKADELEHEVLPATRPRMSIAGWLKRVG